MILVDTSALVASLTGNRLAAAKLRSFFERGERVAIPTLVLYEWLRGPRQKEELEAQEALLPGERALDFGRLEAEVSAVLYRKVKRARGREADLAIAATAIVRDATLWTLNRKDFEDIPGIRLE